eukprot:TRINITY_DN3089_c0_g3_i1.p1 TRINITY_DN3089_c0_g3~~TRINITY_DN3089_c0_g3_i1.p1  ORF type:complete len:489 (-),score=109.84 TRINITY_DN3089_c0_g3_i1:167-1633(-)
MEVVLEPCFKETDNLVVCFLSAETLKDTSVLKIPEWIVNNLGEEAVKEELEDGKGSVKLYNQGKKAVVSGLGPREKVTFEAIRLAANSCAKQIQKMKKDTAVIFIDPLLVLDTQEVVSEFAMYFELGQDSFDFHLTEKAFGSKTITIITDVPTTAIERKRAVVAGLKKARFLGNQRASYVDPAYIEAEARALAESTENVSVTVLDSAKLKELGMNLLNAVGQAATVHPRLIILEYNGNKDSKKKVALVGKGITFDTGGLFLKPRGASHASMHMDMSGSANVFGSFLSLAEGKQKVNVIAALAMAENSIDSTSMHPGDIFKSYRGHTVEILNTDAEGRLVLADALSYIEDTYTPDLMVNIATLTGSAVGALGSYAAALFTHHDDLADIITDIGKANGDRCWRLPLFEEFVKEVKKASCHADMGNMGSHGGEGGCCNAAAFLSCFVKPETRWAHLDLAPEAVGRDIGYRPKGSNGYGLRLLHDLTIKEFM